MIPETLREILKDESIVAIVTQGENGPHVVNTWNSYVTVTEEGYLLIPAGRMSATEENLKRDSRALLTLGSRNVQGLNYVGTGYLVTATAGFEESGDRFDLMKERFGWMRAVLVVKPETFTQTL